MLRQFLKLKVILFSLLSLNAAVEIENTFQKCCHIGKSLASKDGICNNKTVVPDIPREHQSICLTTVGICCATKLREQDCLIGSEFAKTGGSCANKNNMDEQQCCEACKLGLITGTMGACTLGRTSFGTLWDSTFEDCCLDTNHDRPGFVESPANICDAMAGELCSQVCVPVSGSYICQCWPGYDLMSDKKTCKRLDKCDKNRCSQLCTEKDNEIGVVCSCYDGYSLASDGITCLDEDECSEHLHTCDSTQYCINLPGGFKCECLPGYVRDNLTLGCIDVNECQTNSHLCNFGERCDNTLGSYNCVRTLSCGTGYTLNAASNTCEDNDECTLGLDNCKLNGPDWACRNTHGSFRCYKKENRSSSCFGRSCPAALSTGYSCPRGYKIQNFKCLDINECEEAAVCKSGEICLNTQGSYRCASAIKCDAGFKLATDRNICIDIDECSVNKNLCSHKCINTWGSFTCSCHSGYKLNYDNRTCVDENECELNERPLCMGLCINEPGSYRCSCPEGFKLGPDKASCEDIDECSNSLHSCGPNDLCLNTRGSYRCTQVVCPTDYKKDPQRKNRCHREALICLVKDLECRKKPLSYSMFYVTFVSNASVPLDFFNMRGPAYKSTTVDFKLELPDEPIAPSYIKPATVNDFRLLITGHNQATVSLIKSIQGPQDIQLKLTMAFYNNRVFGGTTVTTIDIYISEYNF